MFRPFIGEIIVGKIAACREDGIRGIFILLSCGNYLTCDFQVSLDFFDDIVIPTMHLQVMTNDLPVCHHNLP